MEIAAGFFLGSVVGFLAGMTVSPVTASIITSILALVTAFLGLAGRPDNWRPEPASRVVAFAVGLLLFACLGVFTRTHSLLSPSVADLARQWRIEGMSAEQAAALAVFERTGLMPEGRSASETGRAQQLSSMMFSEDIGEDCASLDRSRFGSAADRLKAMTDLGPPWSVLAEPAQTMGEGDLAALTEGAWRITCAQAPAKP